MREERRQLAMLVEALQLLAAPYEVQVECLPPYVAVPDELALTYDDTYRLVDGIATAGLLTEHQVAQLARIDAVLSSMTDGAPEMWTNEALEHGEAWERVRALARESLSGLGVSPQHPRLDGIAYVGATGDA